MKNKLIYLFVLAVTFFAAVIAFDEVTLALLAFEILLLPGAYVLNVYLSRHLTAVFSLQAATVAKKEEIPVEVCVTNSGYLPIAGIMVEIHYTNEFDGVTHKEQITGMIRGKSTAVFRLKVVAKYAGKITFRTEQIRIWDYFRLLSRKAAPCQKQQSVMVMPDFYPVTIHMEKMSPGFHEQGNRHSTVRSGDDVSEVFDTRNFRAGDTMQRVHWKLSAKVDDLLVKEFSLPVEKTVLLFVDLFWDGAEAWTHERQDELLTILASLSRSMLIKRYIHEVVWYTQKEGRLCHCTILDEDTLFEMIEQVSDSGVNSTPYEPWELYQEESFKEYHDMIRLDTGLHLFSGENYRADLKGAEIGMELGRRQIDIKGW